MTKQATLGPIDPSVNHALSPQVPGGQPNSRVPVSVEAVRGYLEAAQNDLGIKAGEDLSRIFIDLSNKIHPLVLGEIFRARSQIRFLARKLIVNQVNDTEKQDAIIDFLCADSGSHDYTINRREAAQLGLTIEKPSADFYKTIKSIYDSFAEELCLGDPYNSNSVLGTDQQANYSFIRALIESCGGGSHQFTSEGTLSLVQVPGPAGVTQNAIHDERTFDGWRKI